MGRSRAAFIGALIGAVISGALIDLARGDDRVECEPQRVTGDGRHWAYRIIDGRECWYPGRPGKPKNELYWGRGTTPSARQMVEPEAETEPSEPPSRIVAAPPEKLEIAEAMPAEWRATATDQLLASRQTVDQPEAETEPSEPPSRIVAAPPEKLEIAAAEWRATAADQLLAFTCCWPELEEPARPPAWPLALLPLGLYPLWWIAKPRRGLRSVRARDAGRVSARSLTRLRHNGHDGVGERRQVSGAVREGRSVRPDDEQLSPYRQCSTGLGESPTSLFVLPINEQQHVSFASLVDAPDPIARTSVRSRLVTG
jgi:hypothetical protein